MTEPKVQMVLPLIERKHANKLISQRAKDGYINATAMCDAAGRPWGLCYWETRTSREFANALSADIGIPISELIQSIKGGNPAMQGTWVHPQVAIHLAQWLSPVFAVQVTQWVFELDISASKSVRSARRTTFTGTLRKCRWCRRHTSAILQELTYGLIAPMEAQGYTLPEHMVPDISEGRMFAKWLRSNGSVDPSSFPQYRHEYEDGRVVFARLYPNQLLADFREHFHTVWLPTRSVTYFEKRDPSAVKYLKLLLLPAETRALAS